MAFPVESSFNKVVSITKSISWHLRGVHCKKRLTMFLSPAEMSLTKVSLAGNNYSRPGRVWLVTSRTGTRKIANLFLQCMMCSYSSGHGVKGTFLGDEYCFLKIYAIISPSVCARIVFMKYRQNVQINCVFL